MTQTLQISPPVLPIALPCGCNSTNLGLLTLQKSASLSSNNVSASKGSDLHATVGELLYDDTVDEQSTVYSATLRNDQSRVVLKLALNSQALEDLTREANYYVTALKDLQGDVVPWCFGFYEGSCTLHSTGKLGCLLLEYCGKPVVGEFEDLSLEERLKILNALAKLHALGLHHCNFCEGNVLVQNGVYRLTDFTYLEEHECSFNNNWKASEIMPLEEDFGCGRLQNVAFNMSIWDTSLIDPPPLIKIGGKEFQGDLLPPQGIIDKLVVGEYMKEWFNYNERQAWLKDVKAHMEACPEESESQIVEYGKAKVCESGMANNWEEVLERRARRKLDK